MKLRKDVNYYEIIRDLKNRESVARKRGYSDDANEVAFRKYVLILLREISDKLETKHKKYQKRKPSKWNLFMKKRLLQGKTMKETAKEWRTKDNP